MVQSKSNRATPAADGAERRRLRWQRGLERGATLAAMLFAVVLGWSAIRNASRLFDAAPAAFERRPPAVEASAPGPLVDRAIRLLPGDGYWETPGWRWRLGVRRVAEGDLAAELLRIERGAVLTEFDPAEREHLDELLRWIHALPVKTIMRDGRYVYLIDEGSIKLQIVSVGYEDQETIVSLAAAVSNSGEPWQLFELRSAPLRATGEAAHLLPLPPDVERVCTRIDGVGDVQLELLRIEETPRNLLAKWRGDGWQLRPVATGPGSFGYLCARGDETVYAWSPHATRSAMLLSLVRVTEKVKRLHARGNSIP